MSSIANIDITSWNYLVNSQIQTDAITALENGKVIHMPNLSFVINDEEKHLLTPIYLSDKKNISYNKLNGQLRGVKCQESDRILFTALCDRFANYSEQLIQQLFPIYSQSLLTGRTSYRPAEIHGRKAPSYKKDDTLLHVDAFPSSPTQGKRILRIFSNINPNNQTRDWHVGEPFAKVAQRFLPKVTQYNKFFAKLMNKTKITRSYRTHYDHIMLHIHDRMKQDLTYQTVVPFQEMKFPANSTWIVFTDQVSHAALKGQYLLEQTFYLPTHAMHNPTLSPLGILEGLTGKSLI